MNPANHLKTEKRLMTWTYLGVTKDSETQPLVIQNLNYFPLTCIRGLNFSATPSITPSSSKKIPVMTRMKVHMIMLSTRKNEKFWPRWDSNPQSSDSKSDAVSVGPRGHKSSGAIVWIKKNVMMIHQKSHFNFYIMFHFSPYHHKII